MYNLLYNFMKFCSTLDKLHRLKIIMWNVMDYLLLHTGLTENIEELQKVSEFRDKLLMTLVPLLDAENAKIDYDETGKLRTSV